MRLFQVIFSNTLSSSGLTPGLRAGGGESRSRHLSLRSSLPFPSFFVGINLYSKESAYAKSRTQLSDRTHNEPCIPAASAAV